MECNDVLKHAGEVECNKVSGRDYCSFDHFPLDAVDDGGAVVPDPLDTGVVRGRARGQRVQPVLLRDGAADEVHHVGQDPQVD